jgi:hypothetical protein
LAITLTAGVDTVAGTAGNDTINAQAVDATGAAKTTLSGFDAIDGGAGTDTLNIYTTNLDNAVFPTAATVKNVEIINVYNTANAAALGDASKFEGVTQLWQHGTNAVDVSKLAATTTAGFKSVEATIAADIDVSAADAATTVTIALDGVKGDAQTAATTVENRADIDVDGAAVAGVTVSGTLAQKTTASLGAAEVFTATFAGGVTAADTVIFDGRTYTSAGGLTATQEATAFVAAYNNVAATWTAVDNLNGTVTFTKKTVGVVTDVVSGDFTGTAAAQVTAAAPTIQGAATSTTTAAAASLGLNVTAGKDVESLSVNTAVTTTLTVTENAGSAGTKDVRTLDASTSAGGITFAGTVTSGTAGSLAAIKTGAGADTVTIATATLKDDAATATVNEAVSAVLETGAGNDTLTINTSGTGTTNVEAGDGNDTVTLTADGSGILTVNLGAGSDTFKGAGAVSATDVVNAGDGVDTLLLSMVGAANIGAFSNFETFDAVALGKTLDVEILASKNTVTEFVASADVGGTAVLTNVGAGVGFRATGDMTTNALTLTQKTAGALTVTLDADKTSTTAQNDTNLKAVASNATSLKAVFDVNSGYVQNGANLNDQTITVTGIKATALEVVSGGTNATNVIKFATDDVSVTDTKSTLKTITISGDQLLKFEAADLTLNGSINDIQINASAMTGGLVTTLDNVKATGTLSLGSGDDVITVQTGVAVDVATIIGAHRKVAGVEKGSAEDLTAISNYDVFKLTGAIQATDNTAGTADASVKDGLITFKGTGPATLDKAVEFAQALITANQAAVFEYVGKSYIFAEGATDNAGTDVLIELTGVTGLKGLDVVNDTAGTLYVF